MFWPFLLVMIDVELTLGDIGVDILPDFIGWLLIARAIRPMVDLVPLAPAMRSLAFLLAALSLATWIDFPGQSNSNTTVNASYLVDPAIWSWGTKTLESICLLLHALLVWMLVGLMMKIVAVDWYHLAPWRGKLNRTRTAYVVLTLAILWIPWSLLVASRETLFLVGVIALIVGLAVSVILLVQLRAIANFCENNFHANYSQIPDLQGKESSALENAMRPSQEEKRPFRFSLFTIILLMAVIGMASSQIHLIWSTQAATAKATEAEALMEFYKNELSHFDVANEKKAYVIAIPTPDGDHWEWKVHLPQGGIYVLKGVTSQVPESGYPTNTSIAHVLKSGTTTIRAVLDREKGTSGQLRVTTIWYNPFPSRGVTIVGGVQTTYDNSMVRDGTTYNLKDHEFPYLDGSGSTRTDGVDSSDQTREFEPNAPILLLRKNVYPQRTRPTASPIAGTDGIMLWIEEVSP